MSTPISPPPVEGTGGNNLPAYLSNGLLGLRVRPNALSAGVMMVSSFSGEDPIHHVEAAAAAPYPLAVDLALNGIWMSDVPSQVTVTRQAYDFSAAELTTELVFALDGVRAHATVLTFCSRDRPTIACQSVQLRLEGSPEVKLRALIDGRGVNGSPARLKRDGTGEDGASCDGALRWQSAGALATCGIAYHTKLHGADAAETEVGEEVRTAETATAQDFARRRPVRRPLPAHLPRERVVIPAPSACPCCGGKLAKLGEDVTETLEVVPRQWKVIQTVREKFTCRSCERITQPPAPFHPIARGRAGPSLLAMILYAKFGQHQPLNRQGAVYAREGVELDVSTLADWVGACAATLEPLVVLIRRHVFTAERLHGDDTTVPVLAKGRTITGRLWTYVRDDRPFGGADPPAAVFFYSRDRSGEHPRRHLAGYAGILQADAYAGFGELYDAARRPGPVTEAACWSHGRRKFFVLADVAKAPLAIEAVRRIDAIFAIEREINGLPAAERCAVRRERTAGLVAELEAWMRAERARLSRHVEVAKAMDYMLKRWPAFTRFLDDGRICLTNNAAERALRGIALGRKAWLFAGSDRGGERAAAMLTLIETAKLNGVDPQAWLANILRRINDHPVTKLTELLPWHWKQASKAA